MEDRYALLIDSDNVSAKYIKPILDELSKYGNVTYKRIYGDWTKTNNAGWKGELLQNSITPIQQFSYTYGKNATDSAMIIDAMDILHSEKVDGFCIVSSDSDFTRLATRLRESGMLVIGIGEKKTPNPFIVSCDKFIYLEILKVGDTDLPGKKDFGVDLSVQSEATEKEVIGKDLINLFRTTIDDLADDTGWAFLAEVGGLIMKKKPDFDPRNYGFLKLTPLMKSLDKYFQIEEREVENKRIKHIYVKNI